MSLKNILLGSALALSTSCASIQPPTFTEDAPEICEEGIMYSPVLAVAGFGAMGAGLALAGLSQVLHLEHQNTLRAGESSVTRAVRLDADNTRYLLDRTTNAGLILSGSGVLVAGGAAGLAANSYLFCPREE